MEERKPRSAMPVLSRQHCSWGFSENSEFELITWSKDKTLRFWPVDTDMIQVRRANRMPSIEVLMAIE